MGQEHLLDHHPEVRGEATLCVLEFSDDGVVVVAQLQANVRREDLGVMIAHAMPSADQKRDLADDWKVLFIDVFWVHANASTATFRPHVLKPQDTNIRLFDPDDRRRP
jgi:hypothetical protein